MCHPAEHRQLVKNLISSERKPALTFNQIFPSFTKSGSENTAREYLSPKRRPECSYRFPKARLTCYGRRPRKLEFERTYGAGFAAGTSTGFSQARILGIVPQCSGIFFALGGHYSLWRLRKPHLDFISRTKNLVTPSSDLSPRIQCSAMMPRPPSVLSSPSVEHRGCTLL